MKVIIKSIAEKYKISVIFSLFPLFLTQIEISFKYCIAFLKLKKNSILGNFLKKCIFKDIYTFIYIFFKEFKYHSQNQ